MTFPVLRSSVASTSTPTALFLPVPLIVITEVFFVGIVYVKSEPLFRPISSVVTVPAEPSSKIYICAFFSAAESWVRASVARALLV